MTSTEPPAVNWPPFDPGGHRRSGKDKAIIGGLLTAAVAAAAVGVILLTGGDDKPAATPVTPPSPTAPNPTPSPTLSVAPKPEDVAFEQAKARYMAFLEVRNRVAQQGFKSSTPLDSVTVVPQRTIEELKFRRSAGQRQIGETRVASLTATAVDLSPVPGSYPKVVLRSCLDVSGVDIVDAAGRSLITKDRVTRSRSDVTLYRYAKGTEGAETGGWFVYEATSKGEPC